MKKLILGFSVLLLSAGCQSTADQTREKMRSKGYSNSYADGFADGCESGKQAGGSYFDEFQKDINRFNAEQEYAQGWSDAFRQCELKEEAELRQQRMAIEWQNMEDSHKDNIEHEALKGLENVDTSELKSLEKNDPN
ncbi:hypothetical protein [Thalassotalea sp. PS06]|uniref:hypothetical protein n=1 Tax=Thalassotalea sp. PS06 TaxID=2594005 RepID=UPI00116255CE|nr:hypothetical protein [Thalassotalea sp. PS06]QDP02381.1 hypothetical protein FNC98_14110 [Thalassotalea sp. PS06]